MFGYGAGGMLAGFCFRKEWLPRKNWVMAVFGFFAVLLWIGPLLDCASVFFVPAENHMDIFDRNIYFRILRKYQSGRLYGIDALPVGQCAFGKAGSHQIEVWHDGGKRWDLNSATRQ